MESLVKKSLFSGIYEGKKVFVTGHTGFKGSWLCHWLEMLGAEVRAFAKKPNTDPNHFLALDSKYQSEYGDLQEYDLLKKTIGDFQPHIVFHMAAQALVIDSYENPVETYRTNVMGTMHLLQACREKAEPKAIVCITTDKVYEIQAQNKPYKEGDTLGGFDPYSSSKACCEILIQSFRNSFFNLNKDGKKTSLLCSARAGNVVGGGDWAKNRLIPDLVLSAVGGKTTEIRRPEAIRPWQHVLEPLSGYLQLGQKLFEGQEEYSEAWNFGPDVKDQLTVQGVVDRMKKGWDKVKVNYAEPDPKYHETGTLKLDYSKAEKQLGWKPVWDLNTTIDRTIGWYREYYDGEKLLTTEDILQYVSDAAEKKVTWASQ